MDDLGLITRLTDPSLSASSDAERPTFGAGLASAWAASFTGCAGTDAETDDAAPPSDARGPSPSGAPMLALVALDRRLRRSLFLASSALVSTRSLVASVPSSRCLSFAGVTEGTGPSSFVSVAAGAVSAPPPPPLAARRPLAIRSLYVTFLPFVATLVSAGSGCFVFFCVFSGGAFFLYPAAVVDRTLAPCDMGLTAFVSAALSAAASAASLSSDITVGERPFCFE
mmetsp:Transcript_9548/g.43481  ORF Transcript_9548/g.43481 Transcript_9548/m.43481 type:complete len:226 (+) Transcript_9548:1529-2206(+)